MVEICDDALISSFRFRFQVKNEGGRPKIQVQHKGESKTFFAEEVSLV